MHCRHSNFPKSFIGLFLHLLQRWPLPPKSCWQHFKLVISDENGRGEKSSVPTLLLALINAAVLWIALSHSSAAVTARRGGCRFGRRRITLERTISSQNFRRTEKKMTTLTTTTTKWADDDRPTRLSAGWLWIVLSMHKTRHELRSKIECGVPNARHAFSTSCLTWKKHGIYLALA